MNTKIDYLYYLLKRSIAFSDQEKNKILNYVQSNPIEISRIILILEEEHK